MTGVAGHVLRTFGALMKVGLDGKTAFDVTLEFTMSVTATCLRGEKFFSRSPRASFPNSERKLEDQPQRTPSSDVATAARTTLSS